MKFTLFSCILYFASASPILVKRQVVASAGTPPLATTNPAVTLAGSGTPQVSPSIANSRQAPSASRVSPATSNTAATSPTLSGANTAALPPVSGIAPQAVRSSGRSTSAGNVGRQTAVPGTNIGGVQIGTKNGGPAVNTGGGSQRGSAIANNGARGGVTTRVPVQQKQPRQVSSPSAGQLQSPQQQPLRQRPVQATGQPIVTPPTARVQGQGQSVRPQQVPSQGVQQAQIPRQQPVNSVTTQQRNQQPIQQRLINASPDEVEMTVLVRTN